jgi:hypothetical protein
MSDKKYIKDKNAGDCYNAKDMYKEFKKENPDTDITYSLFKHILSGYNKTLVEEIIKGMIFNPNYNIGKILIKKIERSFNKKTIDWGETNKLKKQGIKQMVYFTDNYYYRISWDKVNCTIKNKFVYRFQPTYTFKKMLVSSLKNDALSKIIFEREDKTGKYYKRKKK